MRATFGILTAFLITAAVACGGGDSADKTIGGGSGGSSNLVGDFLPDQPAPVANVVAMKKGGASGNLVTIEITVTDVSGLFGADFDVAYDTSRVQYVNWRGGSVLESGGQSVSYLVEAAQPGRLVVGASRQGAAAGGVNVTGTQTMIEFTFRAIQAGSSGVKFESATLFNAQSPPQRIPGITFAGGTLTAN
jgi:hypothetical protein